VQNKFVNLFSHCED